MDRLERIALDFPATGLSVTRVQIEPVRAGQKIKRFVQVGPKLVSVAGSSRVIPCNRQPTTNQLAAVLEARDIIALPAVQ
jgi:hypothetical protein